MYQITATLFRGQIYRLWSKFARAQLAVRWNLCADFQADDTEQPREISGEDIRWD